MLKKRRCSSGLEKKNGGLKKLCLMIFFCFLRGEKKNKQTDLCAQNCDVKTVFFPPLALECIVSECTGIVSCFSGLEKKTGLAGFIFTCLLLFCRASQARTGPRLERGSRLIKPTFT